MHIDIRHLSAAAGKNDALVLAQWSGDGYSPKGLVFTDQAELFAAGEGAVEIEVVDQALAGHSGPKEPGDQPLPALHSPASLPSVANRLGLIADRACMFNIMVY
ncbi:MAG: hypothetical protein ACREX4_24525, partial [Gammaproteobacteria bacterium]